MLTSDPDRALLHRCLAGQPHGWEDLVDRFLPLVSHVAQHCYQARGLRLRLEERDEVILSIFSELLRDDLALLRRFREQSTLSTYLCVVARRVAVHRLLHPERSARRVVAAPVGSLAGNESPRSRVTPQSAVDDLAKVEGLIARLDQAEEQAKRILHREERAGQPGK